MSVKQIWTSQDALGKSRYGLRTLSGILGITALALVLVGSGTVLCFSMGWPVELLSLFLCGGITALVLVLAAGLGRRSVKDSTVFFLTEEDQLFVVDARHQAGYGGDLISQAKGVLKTQQFLRKLAQSTVPPAGAEETLKVERIKENHSYYALVCRVRHFNYTALRRTYFLMKGIENQELLMRQLERRLEWSCIPEETENRKSFYILFSVLVFCIFCILCVLSHPAVAQLPQSLYFPCLGAAFAALCSAVWFGIRQGRGE